jgi:hypothetical protein
MNAVIKNSSNNKGFGIDRNEQMSDSKNGKEKEVI